MLTSSNSPCSFYYDQNPNATEDQNQEPPFILNFPSSFDDNESPLCQIFSRNKSMAKDHQEGNNKNVFSKKKGNEMEINNNGVIKPPRRGKNHVLAPRKRIGKKDRHSKICTAQGVRDRRMRLSLPIARKFFDLQDMLGFDKASKTIEWLFTKSRKSIKKLLINHNLPPTKHTYLTSDEEDDDDYEGEEINETIRPGDSNDNEASKEMKTNEKEERLESRKVMTNYQNAKKSRERARERARERTREKMKVKSSNLWYESNPTNNLDQPFSLNNFHDSQKGEFHEVHTLPIEHLYENLGSFDHDNNLIQLDHQISNFNNNDALIVPRAIDYCSYTNNGFMGILGNWDANGSRMNPSNIGATSNMISFSSGNNPASIWCLPSKTFPFSLQ